MNRYKVEVYVKTLFCRNIEVGSETEAEAKRMAIELLKDDGPSTIINDADNKPWECHGETVEDFQAMEAVKQ